MTKRITVSVYFDTEHAVRGLVSVTENEKPIQTVGSAVVGSDELTIMIRAAQYTLNAFKAENGGDSDRDGLLDSLRPPL